MLAIFRSGFVGLKKANLDRNKYRKNQATSSTDWTTYYLSMLLPRLQLPPPKWFAVCWPLKLKKVYLLPPFGLYIGGRCWQVVVAQSKFNVHICTLQAMNFCCSPSFSPESPDWVTGVEKGLLYNTKGGRTINFKFNIKRVVSVDVWSLLGGGH